MHKIIYSKGEIDYIESDRVPELFEKIQKRKHIMVGENIRDSITVKNVVKMTDEEIMIHELLKNENSFIQRKVKEEIKLYFKELTPPVVKNMILKYKNN